jgi:chemotaxis methyl-accepting protein methylase
MTDATLATVRVRARGPALRVTTLFRDPDSRSALAARVLPAPWASPAPVLRVWSARTRSGEGAYSIAALLHRHAERVGELARLERVHVLGTDVDAASLAAAARGAYRETAFAGVPPALRARYFGVPGADGHVDGAARGAPPGALRPPRPSARSTAKRSVATGCLR